MTTATAPIRAKRVLPGFTLSLGTTLLYLVLIVLIPIAALILKGAQIGPAGFWAIVSSDRALAAFRVTLTAAAIATAFNAVYGLLMAWVLVRHDFPGKRILAQNYYRVTDETVAAEVADTQAPVELVTVDDVFGGCDRVRE